MPKAILVIFKQLLSAYNRFSTGGTFEQADAIPVCHTFFGSSIDRKKFLFLAIDSGQTMRAVSQRALTLRSSCVIPIGRHIVSPFRFHFHLSFFEDTDSGIQCIQVIGQPLDHLSEMPQVYALQLRR
jgi:hypothetical protein